MFNSILTIVEIIDGVNTVYNRSIQNGKKVDGEMAKGLTITMACIERLKRILALILRDCRDN